MFKFIMLIFVLMFFQIKTYSQTFPSNPLPHGEAVLTNTLNFPQKPTPCPNGGLELNNLTGWHQFCGSFDDPINAISPCVNIRRANTVGVGTDPYGGFPKVFRGNYSLRLGNDSIGAQVDLIYFPITVTNANKNFRFRYAAVLQDPIDHTAAIKPSFSYWCVLGNKQYPNGTVSDLNLFNSTVQTIVADRTNPYWSLNGQVVYKKWTCVSFDLSAYVGQTVSICFQVKDCRAGGHFGYAYIDGLCEPDYLLSQFTLPLAFCNNGSPLIANGSASIGEESHYWDIRECNATGTVGGPILASEWFVGQQAGVFNVSSWLNSKNIQLQCNKYYQLVLAVNNSCTPWNGLGKVFKYTCPYIYNEPDKNVCCPATPCYTLGQNPFVEEPGMPLPDLTYSWTQPPNPISIFTKPKIVVCPTVSTQYVLTVTDINGCKNTDVVNVYFRGPLSIEILNQSGCCPKDYRANIIETPCSAIDALNNSTYPLTVNWTLISGSSTQTVSINSNVSVQPSGGTYSVVASNTCHMANSSIIIPPQDPSFPDLISPSSMRPSSAIAQNKVMIIREFGLSAPFDGQPAYNSNAYELYIFNRWGSIIRVITEDNNNTYNNPPHLNKRCLLQAEIFWDGKDNHGVQVAQGDYSWKLKLFNKCIDKVEYVCSTFADPPIAQCDTWCIIWPHWWQPIWTCCHYVDLGTGCAHHILVLD